MVTLAGAQNANFPNAMSRARKQFGIELRARLGKVLKKAASIADLLTPDDQRENLRVIREAKRATHHIFDQATKSLVPIPDHKLRLAAVTLELAYDEGLPVARQVSVHGDIAELGDMLRDSNEAVRLLPSVHSLPSATDQAE